MSRFVIGDAVRLVLKSTHPLAVEETKVSAAQAAVYEPVGQVLAVSPTSTYLKGHNLFTYLLALQDSDGKPLGLKVFKLSSDGTPAVKIFLPDGIKAAQNLIKEHTCQWETLVREAKADEDIATQFAEAIISDGNKVADLNKWSAKLVADFGKKSLRKHLESCKQQLLETPGLLGNGFEAPITEENFDQIITSFIETYKEKAFIHFHQMTAKKEFKEELIAIIREFQQGGAGSSAGPNIYTGIMQTVEKRYAGELAKETFAADSDEATRFRDRNIRYLLLEQYAMKHKLLPDFKTLFYAGNITEMLSASITSFGKKIEEYWSQLGLKVTENAIDQLTDFQKEVKTTVDSIQQKVVCLNDPLGKFTEKQLANASSEKVSFQSLSDLKTGLLKKGGEVESKAKAIFESAELLMAFLKKYSSSTIAFAEQFPTILESSANEIAKEYHLHDFMEWIVNLSIIPPLLDSTIEAFNDKYQKLERLVQSPSASSKVIQILPETKRRSKTAPPGASSVLKPHEAGAETVLLSKTNSGKQTQPFDCSNDPYNNLLFLSQLSSTPLKEDVKVILQFMLGQQEMMKNIIKSAGCDPAAIRAALDVSSKQLSLLQLLQSSNTDVTQEEVENRKLLDSSASLFSSSQTTEQKDKMKSASVVEKKP